MTKEPNHKQRQLYRNMIQPSQSVSVIEILNLGFVCYLVLVI